jgi:Fe-S cluster assembly ATP-binding protein
MTANINMSLSIQNLHISREGQDIIKGVNLEVGAGEVHALMGPNGSGKSSLANALMSHPKYSVSGGQILLDGTDITALAPDEKAKHGLFLSMQYPPEIPGVTVAHFLRVITTTARAGTITMAQFRTLLKEKSALLKIDPSFLNRSLNEGFSGGEKKRMEILQLALLEPKYAILDETDSGLDVDALKIVAEGIAAVRVANPQMGLLVITHYPRILEHLPPTKVHVLSDGKIAREGGPELAHEIEKDGYAFLN